MARLPRNLREVYRMAPPFGRTSLDHRPTEAVLHARDALIGARAVVDDADDRLGSAVRRAVAAGNSWGTIAAILGVSRQTAHQRFAVTSEPRSQDASLASMAKRGVTKVATTGPTTGPTLGDVVDLLDGWYPPGTADEHDAVGLVSGDPHQEVRRVLFAVDPTMDVAREAAAWGADLLVVHHPLFLHGVHGFAETTSKGRTLATLVRAGCALFTAHTNADRADPGVSDAMASALGLTDLRPLRSEGAPLDKLTVYVPEADAERVRGALSEAGAGRIGDYESASFTAPGEGRFRPLEGARPVMGRVGDLEVVGEARIEVVLDRRRRTEVVAAMLVAHPYETPAWDVVELADGGTAGTGAGRVGDIEPTTLRDFATDVAGRLPATARGILVSGDPDRTVRRVAVAGGAGDFLLGDALGSGADVYVTSDLRHHPATEFVEKGGPALVDVSHWAAEWTWLPQVEARFAEALNGALDTVETRVSTICTDAWRFRA